MTGRFAVNQNNLCILVRQQSGYTNFPCFMCLWDSGTCQEHWTRESWPQGERLEIGKRNIIQFPLMNPNEVLLPPFQIKVWKQFAKALRR